MKITTVFFDIDNTIFNYTKTQKSAVNSLRKKYFPNISEEEFYQLWLREHTKYWALFEANKLSYEQHKIQGVTKVWKLLRKNLKGTEVEKILQEYVHFYESSWETMEYVIPTLETLKKQKINIGILTNGNKEQQLRKLEHIGVTKYIDKDLIVISEDVKFAKPQKEIFIYAQKLANATPEQIMFVGDNYAVDIEPAKLLKWNTFHVNHFDPTQKKVNDFQGLLALLDS